MHPQISIKKDKTKGGLLFYSFWKPETFSTSNIIENLYQLFFIQLKAKII